LEGTRNNGKSNKLSRLSQAQKKSPENDEGLSIIAFPAVSCSL